MRAHPFADVEHVVVDGSTDGWHGRMVEALAADDPRIRLVRQAKCQALGSAQHRLVRVIAASTYVLFVDHDDLL